MKAITLYQPYATLIACGAKQHETRGWRAPGWLIGQRIAIHAGKTVEPLHPRSDRELIEILERFCGAEWLFNIPRGAVVATATLEGCYPTEKRRVQPTKVDAIDLACGDWAAGRWAWHMTDVEELRPPVPARGERSIWEWSGDLPSYKDVRGILKEYGE